MVAIVLVSACKSSADLGTIPTTDSDDDGWSDARELLENTDPHNKDTDGDGYWDSIDLDPLDPNVISVHFPPSPESTPEPEPDVTLKTVPTPTIEPESVPTQTPSDELPAPITQLSASIGDVSQSSELITRDYSWNYYGKWSWEGEIPQSLYEYYQEMPRPPTRNYSVYVTHPLDDSYIELLVEKIRKVAQQEGFSEYQTVEFAAAFVQSLPYTVDSVTTPFDEYPRYPIETLVDNGGDCEDTSILLASIIDQLGYGVVLIILPDHCAVGVKGGESVYGTYYVYEGSKYYYIETTGEGWGIGEFPEEYNNNTSASIRPLIPTPILTHEGHVKGSGYIAEVEVIIHNQGTAPANNVTLLAGFDAGNNMIWNAQESQPITIGVDQKATITLYLQIPLNKHTRLISQIVLDNVLVDESYTDWFDT